MIDFRTKVELPVSELNISYSNRMMLLGSCFSENIGKMLVDSKFSCDVNPFGILYNPLSIASALDDMLRCRTYTADDWELFETDCWHSYMHHSRFSASTQSECLELINERLHEASENLKSLDCLLITFGTAWVYRLASNGCVVANCHKQPDKLFCRELLTVDEIVREYAMLIERLLRLRPSLQILFTVSPIRHIKDGLHGNQISKSVLLLAVDRLCALFPCCHYFPSYEIQLDELRDYRFYATDMTHPSEVAVDYIYSRFSEACFSDSAQQAATDCEKLYRQLRHRPLTDNAEAIARFKASTEKLRQQLLDRYPYLNI